MAKVSMRNIVYLPSFFSKQACQTKCHDSPRHVSPGGVWKERIVDSSDSSDDANCYNELHSYENITSSRE